MPTDMKKTDAMLPNSIAQKIRSLKKRNSKNDSGTVIELFEIVQELCNNFNVCLSETEHTFEDKKKECIRKKDEETAVIDAKEKKTVAELEKEYDNEMRSLQERKNSILEKSKVAEKEQKKKGVAARFLNDTVSKLLNESFFGAEKKVQAKKDEARSAEIKFLDAYEKHRRQTMSYYKERFNCVSLEAQKVRAAKNNACEKKVASLSAEKNAITRELVNCHREMLSIAMDTESINQLVDSEKASKTDADNFICPESLPQDIKLGRLCTRIAKKKNSVRELSELLSAVPDSMLRETADEFRITLPYFCNIDDGISLFLNYSASDRNYYRDALRMIMLKLFSAFPAGKLEATMIDPLELGDTFAMFTKLGAEQPRIIDTKIWSQDKDIEDVMRVLRQKFETMTLSYGGDKEARKKKEPFRVLAITDFPTGFSQTALRDLQAIVRKSADYGVAVLIWSNSDETAKLEASELPVYNEIKQMLRFASSAGKKKLMLKTEASENIMLELDTLYKDSEKINRIINTVADGIHNAEKKIEHFSDMFSDIFDSNNWFKKNSISELSLPLGIKGADTVVKMIMGKSESSTAHHALIAGQTGAGKSTALHTLIMGALLNYSPEELQLYLIDFKEGVEFKTYSRHSLPSVKVVAIDCEREFGLNILKDLHREMKRRYDMFKREADREDISDYRKVTGKKLPRLLVIFDEVQELFREKSGDALSKECETLLGELLTLGRAAGIHFVLASQNFNLISSIKPVLFAHSAIRIAIKGSDDSASSVLGDGNSGAKQLQDGSSGAAVYNNDSGKESANVVFQISYLEKDKRSQLLREISRIQTQNGYKTETRILLTSAEDGTFNCYNRFINDKKLLSDEADFAYRLYVGEGFDVRKDFSIKAENKSGQNLLMIGKDERKAAAMFCFSVLSVFLNDVSQRRKVEDNCLINLIDLSQESEYSQEDNTNFSHLEKLFAPRIKRAGLRDMIHMTDEIYEHLERRMNGEESSENRLFLMFFGVNRAYKMAEENMYEDSDFYGLSTLGKLREIMKNGGKYGINCIFWGESLKGIYEIVGEGIMKSCSCRIVFSSDGETMEKAVKEFSPDSVRESTAVYLNIDEDVKNTHFRPFDIPERRWVEKIASRYSEYK